MIFDISGSSFCVMLTSWVATKGSRSYFWVFRILGNIFIVKLPLVAILLFGGFIMEKLQQEIYRLKAENEVLKSVLRNTRFHGTYKTKHSFNAFHIVTIIVTIVFILVVAFTSIPKGSSSTGKASKLSVITTTTDAISTENEIKSIAIAMLNAPGWCSYTYTGERERLIRLLAEYPESPEKNQWRNWIANLNYVKGCKGIWNKNI